MHFPKRAWNLRKKTKRHNTQSRCNCRDVLELPPVGLKGLKAHYVDVEGNRCLKGKYRNRKPLSHLSR